MNQASSDKVSFIFRKDQSLSSFTRGGAQTHMLAKAESVEVLRHVFPPKVVFHLTSADEWQGFEFIQIISGQLLYLDSKPTIKLNPGDYIVRHLTPERAMFEAAVETEVLYMSSAPAFNFVREEMESYVELAHQVEKDEYTVGHCYRIQHLARLLGESMGVVGESLQDLVNAAFFHDLGKAKVPKEILCKPSSLNDEEWEVMKQHTIWGREMLESNPEFERVGLIIEQTHERVDGEGYPHQLTGDKILLEAKIIAVVDAYDAMSADRPYRKALPQQEVLKRLQQSAGTQLDEAVVVAFIGMLEQEGLKLPDFDKEIVRLKRHESFLKLGEAILANSSVQEILQQVVEGITNYTPFQRALLTLYKKPIFPLSTESVEITHLAGHGLTDQEMARVNESPFPAEDRPKLFMDRFRISRSFYVPHTERRGLNQQGWVESASESTDGSWHPDDSLCIPLWADQAMMGYISVDDPYDGQAPTAESLEPMEVFANFAALAIERAQHLTQLSGFQDRLKAIYSLSEQLANASSVGTLVEEAMNILTESFEHHHASISFLENEVLVLQSFKTRLNKAEYQTENFERIPLSQGVLGQVATTRKTLTVPDVREHPNYIRGHPDIRSELAAPIEDQDQLLGVLNLESTEPNGFNDEDKELLLALARQMGAAINNLRRQEQLRQSLEERQWTNEFLKRLSQVNELEELMTLILERGIQLLAPKADAGCFILWNKHLQIFEFTTAVNRDMTELKTRTFTRKEVEKDILGSANPVVMTRTSQLNHRTLKHLSRNGMQPPGSTIAVPVREGDELIAVFNINCMEREGVFNQEDAELVWQLVTEIELALSRVQDRERLKTLAIHDPLTGVHNRHYLSELIDAHVDRSVPQSGPVSFLLVDFIGFHQVNDRFGHLEGDRILSEAAALFALSVRETDAVIRYGGDEFLIYMPNTLRLAAEDICARLKERLRQQDWGLPIQIEFRAGVATWEPDSDQSFNDVLEQADALLYDHKRRSKTQSDVHGALKH